MAVTITLPVLAVAIVLYLVLNPDKAEKLAGWVWRGVARAFSFGEQKAVAYSVQGDINTARAAIAKDVPHGVIGGKLKIKWAKPEEAHCRIGDGEVIVFMRKSRHREENVANAVMAYLPKAVIPRARSYVDRKTMRAVDLTLARTILQRSNMPAGTLETFFERHLDPALLNESDLKERLDEVDAIDLHGWLTRVMLAEYRVMGEKLYPHHADDACLSDARSFCEWLGKLARRTDPHDYTTPLRYKGRFLDAAIVFVAMKGKLESEGLVPYRKRAKQLIYTEKCDVVYLMARDHNIHAVKALHDDLKSDGLIEQIDAYEFPLRSDFKSRIMHRERAIIVVLRRKISAEEGALDEADVAATDHDEIEVYEPPREVGVEREQGEHTPAPVPDG